MRKQSSSSSSMASTKLTLLLTTFLFSSLLFTFSQAKSSEDSEPYVGVNISTDVSKLLSPSEIVSFLQPQKITHVRLYDAELDILKSLERTKIRIMISVPNNQLLAIGSSNTTAASWIDRNVIEE